MKVWKTMETQAQLDDLRCVPGTNNKKAWWISNQRPLFVPAQKSSYLLWQQSKPPSTDKHPKFQPTVGISVHGSHVPRSWASLRAHHIHG